MIELFVFDLGNVILPFNHLQIVPKLLERSADKGRFPEQEVFDYIFDYEKGLINLYEEGTLPSLEFFSHLRDRYDLRLQFEEFSEIWNNIFQENYEVNEFIVYLKTKGLPVFLLSNTNELHFCHILQRYPIIHVMDEWILSFEVGAKKPGKRIYDAIFEKTDIKKERVLCIDDVADYVASARTYGMQGLVFKEAADLWRTIEEVDK
jgi:glucose-1-phosphatase